MPFSSDSIFELTNYPQVFKQELAWASHLSLPNILLPPASHKNSCLAQTVNQSLSSLTYLSAFLPVPLINPKFLVTSSSTPSLFTSKSDDPWEWWNSVRTLTEFSSNLFVALELNVPLNCDTSLLPSEKTINKWLGEPVKCLIISASSFQKNKKGNLVLPKFLQELVQVFMRRKNISILIRPITSSFIANPGARSNISSPHVDYLRWCYKRVSKLSDQEAYEGPYLDFLQAPLQPLMDNLESNTYETFEKDPVKYRNYEEAVFNALTERKMGLWHSSNPKLPKQNPDQVVLMVVGAGRGPLVQASINAGVRCYGSDEECRKYLKVYALDKNPNAAVTLLNRKRTSWKDQVTVVNQDMRYWQPPETADILVSELLGSFGDNELSPECLDGAMRFLSPGGISIPSEYTSFVAPLSSSKLWNEVKALGDKKHFETAYVVKFSNVDQLDEAKECFRFTHPKKYDEVAEENEGNTRYKRISWKVEESSVLHGFAGYFDSVLYKSLRDGSCDTISINPKTFSEGMISWFPLYFPLKNPVYLERGAEVDGEFWRCTGGNKVWYEWGISKPYVIPVMNPNGRSYFIGL